jgi:hypothetical protein
MPASLDRLEMLAGSALGSVLRMTASATVMARRADRHPPRRGSLPSGGPTHSDSKATELGFFCRSVKYSARNFSICLILSIRVRS